MYWILISVILFSEYVILMTCELCLFSLSSNINTFNTWTSIQVFSVPESHLMSRVYKLVKCDSNISLFLSVFHPVLRSPLKNKHKIRRRLHQSLDAGIPFLFTLVYARAVWRRMITRWQHEIWIIPKALLMAQSVHDFVVKVVHKNGEIVGCVTSRRSCAVWGYQKYISKGM